MTVGFFSARGRPARIACGLPRQLACNGAVAHAGSVGARLLTPHPRAPARCPQSAAPAARWLPSTKISPGPAAGASPSLSSARVRRTQPPPRAARPARARSMTSLERPARPHTPGAPEPDRRLAAQDGACFRCFSARSQPVCDRADAHVRYRRDPQGLDGHHHRVHRLHVGLGRPGQRWHRAEGCCLSAGARTLPSPRCLAPGRACGGARAVDMGWRSGVLTPRAR